MTREQQRKLKELKKAEVLLHKKETGGAEKQKIAEYIKTVRSDIEEYIYYRYQDFKLEIDYKSLYAWIQNKYPWIDNENMKHAVSQGIYYAMK